MLDNALFIGSKENANTFILHKSISLNSKPKKVIINATALGMYFIKINGKRLGDAYFAPGWTSYNKMLQVQSYDAKSYFVKGDNNIEMCVNVGWYAGRLAFLNNYNVYGNIHAGCMEINIDGVIYNTDLSWNLTTSNIIDSSLYDGETISVNTCINELHGVVVDFDKKKLVKQICEPVKNIIELDVKEELICPSGKRVFDFGQNIAGIVRVKIPNGLKGKIQLHFAEVLIKDEFYNENYRSAKSIDEFEFNGGEIFEPEFTFHGFRYLYVQGTKLDKSCFTAVVRHTDMKQTGKIEVDDPSFNKLMENITWGQRGNFVDLPTDCPQRDERLGWSGDINAFARTACYNFDCRLIIKKWLKDMCNDQLETGEVPHFAPMCLKNNYEPSAFWTDAICQVPWTMYQMYNDKSFLFDNLEAMVKYINCLETKMDDGLIVKGQVYGDWLALDNEVLFKNDSIGRTDKFFLGNVFYLEDCKIVEAIYKLLGNKEEAKKYNLKYKKTLSRMRTTYFNKYGKFMLDTVTSQVLAVYFDIVDKPNKQKLVDELAQNVIKHGTSVTTGFIGTAYFLYALADNGYFDLTSKVIMNHNYPGWLYEVDMGATTMWERWSSIFPDGTTDSKGMNSFNHYAYGAMKEFIYQKVAGINPAKPGFKKILFTPHVVSGLNEVSASYNSIKGLIKASYVVLDNKTTFTFSIPKGVKADVILPNGNKYFNVSGDVSYNI